MRGQPRGEAAACHFPWGRARPFLHKRYRASLGGGVPSSGLCSSSEKEDALCSSSQNEVALLTCSLLVVSGVVGGAQMQTSEWPAVLRSRAWGKPCTSGTTLVGSDELFSSSKKEDALYSSSPQKTRMVCAPAPKKRTRCAPALKKTMRCAPAPKKTMRCAPAPKKKTPLSLPRPFPSLFPSPFPVWPRVEGSPDGLRVSLTNRGVLEFR